MTFSLFYLCEKIRVLTAWQQMSLIEASSSPVLICLGTRTVLFWSSSTWEGKSRLTGTSAFLSLQTDLMILMCIYILRHRLVCL